MLHFLSKELQYMLTFPIINPETEKGGVVGKWDIKKKLRYWGIQRKIEGENIKNDLEINSVFYGQDLQ